MRQQRVTRTSRRRPAAEQPVLVLADRTVDTSEADEVVAAIDQMLESL